MFKLQRIYFETSNKNAPVVHLKNVFFASKKLVISAEALAYASSARGHTPPHSTRKPGSTWIPDVPRPGGGGGGGGLAVAK